MSFLIKKPDDIKSSEITSQSVYHERREFIKKMSLATTALIGAGHLSLAEAKAYPELAKSQFSSADKLTSLDDIKSYNNFYEFGTGKVDPAKNAKNFNPKPWSIAVEGEIEKPGVFDLEDFVKPYALEERIYRFRCVEGWSMVIPWVGFPLADMIKQFKPTSKAKYVEFVTLYDKEKMPGQAIRVLPWPYTEGLRIDEAMNPLTLMAVGLYGDELPNQNGAPIRLVVPWKYGFKNIKSIVKIRFTEHEPVSTWHKIGPKEYGFYSNVNPDVDHPRWSQKTERRIGEPFWSPKIQTQMFNGYSEQVAHLYSGMDLKRFF
ncbi:MAG: protein-methionine-sulfoxide reductase catalytic subunit MsrP [Gammaproteobacteria bacterium]|nr:protein-methionine-sulfoxide reductase catalytic subunit MsrP [Gammaproteobacteria bacterium]